MGHTVFNWALKQVSATFIALAILGEPIGSAMLALALFDEGFSRLQIAGFVLLLVGIYLGARSETGIDVRAAAAVPGPEKRANE
jgi:drug/metabolite transporter (DMT)-like permease